MKRTILSIIIFFSILLIGCSNSSSNSSENEYIFRNIPYKTHYDKAKEILFKSLKAEGITKELTETINGNIIKLETNEKVDIAGHKADGCICYFVNEDDESVLDTNNLNKAIIKSGKYYFYTKNSEELNTIYNDILDKLIKLYGEPTIRDDENKRIKWKSETEKTVINLRGAEKISEIDLEYVYFYLDDNTENSDNNYNGL